MAINDFLSQGPSLIGVFLMALAAIYLFGALLVGFVRDRKEAALGNRNYVPPSEGADRRIW